MWRCVKVCQWENELVGDRCNVCDAASSSHHLSVGLRDVVDCKHGKAVDGELLAKLVL